MMDERKLWILYQIECVLFLTGGTGSTGFTFTLVMNFILITIRFDYIQMSSSLLSNNFMLPQDSTQCLD